MEILQQKIDLLQGKFRSIDFPKISQYLIQSIFHFLQQVKTIGSVDLMDDYEKRKLGVFNLLNFIQLITGLLSPLMGLLHRDKIPGSLWMLACLPCFISISVLFF